MRDRVSSFRFLCDALTPWADDQVNDKLRRTISSGTLNWGCVVAIATEHVVITTLLSSLIRKDLVDLLPDDLREYLRELHRLNRGRNKRIRAQTKNVVNCLNAVGVEPVLLKGAAFIFADKHIDLGSRIMIDIDLLIRHEDAKTAVDTLFSTGFEIGVDEPELYDFAQHFPPMVHPSEPVPVELHTELLSPMTPQVLKASLAFNDSKAVTDDGLTFRLLSPSDSIHYTLLHTEIHHRGYSSGAVFLKGLHDYATLAISHGADVNWPHIQSLMKEHGLEDVLRSYLYVASRLFRVPTPSSLVATRSNRMHFRRCLMQVHYKWLMFIADRAAEVIWLFSTPAIQTRFGCSDKLLSLVGGRLKYILYLFRTYVFGHKKNRLLDVLIGRQK